MTPKQINARRDAAVGAVAELAKPIPDCERKVTIMTKNTTCIDRGDEHCRPCHARFYANRAAESIRIAAGVLADIGAAA